jgi:hypothetical protein
MNQRSGPQLRQALPDRAAFGRWEMSGMRQVVQRFFPLHRYHPGRVALGGRPFRRATAVQFSDLTPRDQNGGAPGLGQTLAFALPWILLAVLALWALRH